jgi:hypothetical protein
MTAGHANHPLLITGHIAVAALALAAMRVVSPIANAPQWHQPRQPSLLLSESPRRVPMPRRTNRSIAVTLLD